jgi:hypothetical protein
LQLQNLKQDSTGKVYPGIIHKKVDAQRLIIDELLDLINKHFFDVSIGNWSFLKIQGRTKLQVCKGRVVAPVCYHNKQSHNQFQSNKHKLSHR